MLKIKNLLKGTKIKKTSILILSTLLSTGLYANVDKQEHISECMPVELKLEVFDSKNEIKTREMVLMGCEKGIDTSISYLAEKTHFYSFQKPLKGFQKPFENNKINKIVEGFSVNVFFLNNSFEISILDKTLEKIKTETIGDFSYQMPEISTSSLKYIV
jgi:hypothetical protein